VATACELCIAAICLGYTADNAPLCQLNKFSEISDDWWNRFCRSH